jgi:hypothetical protein
MIGCESDFAIFGEQLAKKPVYMTHLEHYYQPPLSVENPKI